MARLQVVLYVYPTSNHNISGTTLWYGVLFYMSILHQTTTSSSVHPAKAALFYMSILHQTTTRWIRQRSKACCSICLSYIKPQQILQTVQQILVVLYVYPTSNHNLLMPFSSSATVVLYVYPTSNHNLNDILMATFRVVLYVYPTSNHNSLLFRSVVDGLFYMSILHQTTTRQRSQRCCTRLFYMSILHQTTTRTS